MAIEFQIGSRWVGDTHPVFIIAEAGINHQGDPDIARSLIDVAVKAGANAIKFQKRSVGKMLIRSQLNMPYVNPHSFGRTYGEHRRALELSTDTFQMLKEHAETRGILFFASAWDEESAHFLESLDVPAFKVASADLTNLPLLDQLARKQKPLLISTGMSTLDEVRAAVDVVRRHTEEFALLQCTAAYPAALGELNLRAIALLRERFNCVVGYSGHEQGTLISAAAVAVGASIVERHLTLDRTMKGGDHAASLEPDEFAQLVCNIRNVEEALGKPEKRIWPSERSNRWKLSKSVVTACKIERGTPIRRDMLTIKSPGSGISAARLNEVIGRVARHDIEFDSVLSEEDLVS